MDWKRLVLALGVMLALTTDADAVPLEFAYQGTVFDADGAALAGEHTLTVTIYADAEGGDPLWREAHVVTLTDGYFSLALGRGEAVGEEPHPELDSLVGHATLFLAIQVDDQDESAERLTIASVPYALVAASAENVPEDEDIEELARGVCFDTEEELTDILDPIYTGDVSWDRLEDFPPACEQGKAVTGVGATLTCTTFDKTNDTIADDGVITLGTETAGTYDATPDTIADDGVITLGTETAGSFDVTADTIADDGVIALGTETSGPYDATPDTIADDGSIALGTETTGPYDATADTIADDGFIALGTETTGPYDATPDTIADDGVIALGTETSGSFDATPDSIADDGVITLGAETAGSFDATPDTIADDDVIALGLETFGDYDDTPDTIADDGLITLGVETDGDFDATPDTIADDGLITLGVETDGDYDDTPDTIADDDVITLGLETAGDYDATADTIADDGVITLGAETAGDYDATADTIADDGVITLGLETAGDYDATADTIADDGVISDGEASDALTINNGILYAPTSGFVGVGTTTPDEMLDVDGNVHTSGELYVGDPGSLPAIKLAGDDPNLRWSMNASSIVLNGVLNNIMNLGWNVRELAGHEVPTEPTLHLQFESRFHTLPVPGAPELMEFILAYRSTDGQNRRPYQVGVDRATHRSNHQFQGGMQWLTSDGTRSVIALEDGGHMYLNEGTSLYKAGNNQSFLRQVNAAGSQWMELMRLNDNDKLVISGSGADTVFAGRVGILTSSPNFALEVVGAAAKPGGGSWTDSSDRRLKKNILPLTGALDTMLRLRGVTYEWREPEKHGNLTGPQRGMIAQEVEEVVPEWIGTDPHGMKTLTFRGFESLTVESLRTLKAENDALAADNAALRGQLDELATRMDALDGGGSLASLSHWFAIAPMGMALAWAWRRNRNGGRRPEEAC
jgi:hypothetical protein